MLFFCFISYKFSTIVVSDNSREFIERIFLDIEIR